MKQTVLTYLNRFIAFGGAILALATGLVPILTDADWTSTAGIIAGLAVAGGFVSQWLHGWQKDEERKAYGFVTPTPSPVVAEQQVLSPVVFDAEHPGGGA